MDNIDDFGMDDTIYLQECQDEKFEFDNPVLFQYNNKTETENN